MPALNAYADAAPDLRRHLDNTTTISNSIVDQQQNLDAFLVSAIGLADIGNDVVGEQPAGADRRRCTCWCRPPTCSAEYQRQRCGCGIGGLVPFAKSPPQYTRHRRARQASPSASSATATRGPAEGGGHSGGAATARHWACPTCRRTSVPPFVVADVGANPAQYGNQGILLNSDALKQAGCSARSTGRRATPRRSDSPDDARDGHAHQVRRLRGGDGAADRVPVLHLRPVPRTGSTNGYSAVFTDASRLKSGDSVRVAGIRVGTVDGRVAAARPQGARRVRRRPQHQADHRHQGRDPLPQPRRRPLPRTGRRPGLDQDAARRARRSRSTAPRRHSISICCSVV